MNKGAILRKTKDKSILVSLILSGSIGLISSIYYYCLLWMTELPFHSDDAGSLLAIYDENILGGTGKTSGNLQIFMIVSRVCYLLFGYSEKTALMVFAIDFFLLVFLSLFLILENPSGKSKWIEVAFFSYLVVLQGTYGNAEIQISKFHTNSVICWLALLCLLQLYLKNPKKRYVIGLLFFFIFSLLQSDFLISIIIIVIPLITYALLYNFKRNTIIKKKTIFGVLVIGIVICDILKCLLSYTKNNLLEKLIIWGGDKKISSLDDLMMNLYYGTKGLLGMFNIIANDISLLSVDGVFFVIRLAVFLTMMAFFVQAMVKMISGDLMNSPVDELLMISSSINIFVYLLVKQEGPISMRYCVLLLFAIPLVALRNNPYTDRLSAFAITNRMKLLTIILCVGVIFGSIKLWPHTQTEMEVNTLADTIVSEKLGNGISAYWAAGSTTALLQEEYFVQAVEMKDEQVASFMNEYSVYSDKCKPFNYIVVDKEKNDFFNDNVFGVDSSLILDKYGQPEKIIEVTNNKSIYVYDYDVRSYPQKFHIDNEDNSGLYSLLSGTELNYSIQGRFLGEYFVRVNCDSGARIDVQIEDDMSHDIDSNSGEAKIYYKTDVLLDCINIKIKNLGEKQISISSIELLPINESMEVIIDSINSKEIDCKSLYVKKGEYKIVIYGIELNELELDCNQEDIKLLAKEKGEKRHTYNIICDKDCDVDIVLTGISNNSRVEAVYLESVDSK